MKVALICDDLIQMGGAEKVFLGACSIWPEADVFTSVVSPRWEKIIKDKHINVKRSFLQRFPFSVKLNRYYSMLLFHIFAFESFDLSSYDLVVSFSSRYAHFVITKPGTVHVCYMHSPGRMFWEMYDYFEKESFGPLSFLKRTLISVGNIFLYWIRLMDYAAAQRVDYFISNSVTTRSRIKKYYGRDSEIIHPFINAGAFRQVPNETRENYFLVLSRLAPWKRIDIAIKACNALGLKLKVAGEGPAYDQYKKLAAQDIQMLGYVSEEQKSDLIAHCSAVINTQKEDFGIVPLEVMSYGKPVIAYGKGGVLETVLEGKTGEFFYEQTPEDLEKVLKEFDPMKYYPQVCIDRAANFSFEKFRDKLSSFTNVVYLKHNSL